MAIKGLSKLVMADYEFSGSFVTYTNPELTEKMSEYTLDITQSDDNILYLDNDAAEIDSGTFQSGQFTVNTGNLSQENSIRILGIKENEIMINGTVVKELVYDDDIKAPILGVGFIELHQVDNIDKYKAIFLNKVIFKIPKDAAKTKGENVEWQLKEIVGTVMRSQQSDSSFKHPWKCEAWFDDEASALEYLMTKGDNAGEVPA